MKKLILFIGCLALLSLACLQTVAVADQIPVSTATHSTATTSPVHVAKATSTIVAMAPGRHAEQGCAVVTAIEALHVRQGTSERTIILAWLRNGDVVHVVDQSDGDWWFIEHAGKSGYARSTYLKAKECE